MQVSKKSRVKPVAFYLFHPANINECYFQKSIVFFLFRELNSTECIFFPRRDSFKKKFFFYVIKIVHYELRSTL